MSIPLTEPEHVAGVARAVVDDPRVAQLLAEMIDVLGPYGNILIQPGYGLGHEYGFREGSRFPGEYVSRFLLSDRFRHIAALDEPHVVVADFHFEEAGHVLHLLDLVTQAGGDKLFIICKNMWEKAIDALVAYNARGPITTYAATIKPFEDLRRDMMRDIALLTGASFITDVAGMSPLGLTVDDLGQADRIVATEEYVSIVGGGGDGQVVQAHTDSLASRLRQVEERTEQRAVARAHRPVAGRGGGAARGRVYGAGAQRAGGEGGACGEGCAGGTGGRRCAGRWGRLSGGGPGGGGGCDGTFGGGDGDAGAGACVGGAGGDDCGEFGCSSAAGC